MISNKSGSHEPRIEKLEKPPVAIYVQTGSGRGGMKRTKLPIDALLFAHTRLTRLQVVAGYQPDLTAASMHRRLPPPVILVPKNGQDVALGEPELLRDGGLVNVQCSG